MSRYWFRNTPARDVACTPVRIQSRSYVAGLIVFFLTAAAGLSRPDGLAMAQAVQPAAVEVDYAVTTQDLDQTWPVAVFNDVADEYLVVFEHNSSSSNSDIDVHARRIGRAGSPASDTFVVVQSSFRELHPDVAANSTNGEYLVVWGHVASASDHDVKAVRVSSAGTPGSAFPVAVVATTSEEYPAVAYNATRDEYLVVWQQASIDSYVIRGRRVAADGALLGSLITVGTASSSLSSGTLPYQPDVVWDSANDRYLVVWAKYTGTEYDIAGQRVAGDGALTGDPLVIEDWQHDQIKPKAEYNPHRGEFMVVWEDHHWANGLARDIYARRVDDSGVFNSDRLGVAWGPYDSNDRLNPVIAYKAVAREYMVSWELDYYLTGRDVYRRRLGVDGELLEDELVVINTGSHEKNPTIAADSAGLYLVAWEDSRNLSATEIDIYAALPPTDYFSGHVYNGKTWDSVTPLAGATVKLYCSDSPGNLGALLQTTTTDAQGSYRLMVVRNCEFWHLVETIPDGYQPVTARSPDAEYVDANYLRYVYPLTGKDLSGNDFLNTPDTGIDDVPPATWANFAPAGWVNNQTVTASIQVQDTGTGLNVGSAEFATSTDAGATWGDWRPATCSGVNRTTALETITAASVPFGQDSAPNGQNRIRFRISDMQGNPPGVSGMYGVAIDSTAPPKPTGLKSTSHQTSVWSKDNTVNAEWDAVTDAGSGLAGYTVEWSKAPNTTPDLFLDTATSSATSSALENTDLWYVHVVAVDTAGNVSAAAHLGPFYIDALAPLTGVGFLDPYQGTLNFTVAWSEATTYGSPLTGFDIKVVETWDGGNSTTTWQSKTLQLSATFTGVLGHSYAFYSRGYDAAGNQELYPATPDATTTVGKDMVVVVVDEANRRVPDAETFLNGTFVGSTYANGEWVAKNVLVGDQLAARRRVYTHPAAKPDHGHILPDLGGASYGAWHAYITSVGFDAAGNPQVFQVANLDQSPELTLRKSQALIGIRFLVCVQWDADEAYLADLEEGMHKASAYLYDLTDGQMVFDSTVVWDNHRLWDACDMRIYASNQIWPHAWPNGIENSGGPLPNHIYMGRFFDGDTSNQGAWKYYRGFSSFIHEFGHYGLHLYDEYLSARGDLADGGYCTENKWYISEDQRGCFMDNLILWESVGETLTWTRVTEMCSTVDPNYAHRTNTQQHAEHSESCWATVQKKYDDNNQDDRWLILTPVERGAVMPGPDTIPVADWSRVYLHDLDTFACAPFSVTVGLHPLFGEATSPLRVDVYVLPNSFGGPIYQGETDVRNQITVYGAHNGDILRVQDGYLTLEGTFVGSATEWPIECITKATAAALQPLVPAPDAFSLMVASEPLTGNRAQIRVEASVPLKAPPAVNLWQTGVDTATVVVMSLLPHSTVYVGEATLNQAHEASGLLYLSARDQQEHEVRTLHQFVFTPVQSGDLTAEVYSDDGVARLVLRADSLAADAVVVMQTAHGGDPGALVLVSGPYAIGTNSVPLTGDASVHMAYMAEAAAGSQTESLHLYRWDEQASEWLAQTSTHNAELHLVSAGVNALGVFAILGQPSDKWILNLPCVMRSSEGSAARAGQAFATPNLFLPGLHCSLPAGAAGALPAVGAHSDLTHNLYLPLVR